MEHERKNEIGMRRKLLDDFDSFDEFLVGIIEENGENYINDDTFLAVVLSLQPTSKDPLKPMKASHPHQIAEDFLTKNQDLFPIFPKWSGVIRDFVKKYDAQQQLI